MLLTFLGVLLISVPFLLIFRFNNRLLGFSCILGSLLVVHLSIGFLTQFFHIFTYPVIITIHSIIALATLYILRYKSPSISFKLNFNWFVILSFIIIFFELWSVHFFYTGTVSSINGYKYVSQSSNPYPYFSDEWIGVSFSNYSIENNALPIVNPLNKNNNFPNIFVSFFSLIAELFLVLNISPLLGYAYFSIFSGFIICLLLFVIMRISKIGLFASTITSLCLPFIINGLNLPGIWYLLPYTGGLILFLLSLIGFLSKKNFFAYSMGIVSLLLYPPILVLLVPTFLFYIISNRELDFNYKTKIILLGFLFAVLMAVFIVFSQSKNINSLLGILISSVWRMNLDGGIPTYYIWNIIPIILIPFIFIGIFKTLKEKTNIILIPVIIGIILWFIYTFSQFYLIIDYARVVIITSILLLFFAGFGFDIFFRKIINRYKYFFTSKVIFILKIIILLFFLILSFNYTNSLRWSNLKLRVTQQGQDYYFLPSAPASDFLTDEDIALFSSFSKKRFLSPDWKGLTIGVATNNYPLDSKASIITNHMVDYNKFISKNCEVKYNLSKKYKIEYIYSSQFDCKGFVYIGESSEGLFLYKFKK